MIEKHIGLDLEFSPLFSFEKRANFIPDIHVPNEIEQYIKELNPDPRFVYGHVIGMSAGDLYGSNLNGDIFRANELTGIQTAEEAVKNKGELKGVPLPRFKTFEQAKFYRHHANSPADPAYGDIPIAAWNDPMQRVEMIVRICKVDVPEIDCHAAPDIVVKFDKRGFICVSMGTKIHHEQCTYCKNENEFVSQRCDCLKKHMNEIMPDGRMVAADNFGSRFFDLSDVTIPADPIAMSIQKVACLTVPRVNFAKDEVIIRAKYGAWKSKTSGIEKHVPCVTVGDAYASRETVEEFPENMDASFIKKAFAAAGDLNTFVSTCTAAAVVLTPLELAYATYLQDPEKVAEGSFEGVTDLSLDNFSVSAYLCLRSKFAERSGFFVPCPESGLEPAKLAGYEEVSDYYSYYRKIISEIPAAQFEKAAYRNPHVRELAVKGSVKEAMFYLANAGFTPGTRLINE
jgi:hypothetical protein